MAASDSPLHEAGSLPPTGWTRPELLAPAGDWECVRAAVENGANAIYFGLDRFNARMRANNFAEADLAPLMAFLHRRGVRGYVTFNTLVFQNELPAAEQYLRTIIAAGVDAVIVQDVGLCRLIRQISPDFPIHASTQMTITSAAGVEFARDLGCQLVVLARECSIAEIAQIRAGLGAQGTGLPLEVFVHGALCVAYSGQCLTSEALGGRSANRGECAQACRLPYDLLSDGQVVPLGDRRYLLSPQDLAGLDLLPDLVRAGVASLKIEGRLKSPEYVANVTRVYREALDRLEADGRAGEGTVGSAGDAEGRNPARYDLEMAFSRGLFTGWLGGVNNQALVHARFGKKRGVYLGDVVQVGPGSVTVRLAGPLKAGDGVVFDAGRPELDEQGGRVYQLREGVRGVELRFGNDAVDFSRVQVGNKVWKTSDQDLERRLRQTFEGDKPRFQRPLDFEVRGALGGPLVLTARSEAGESICLESATPLVAAERQPLTQERLAEQLGRLGGTPFRLGKLVSELPANLMLPVSEINRLRREVVSRLETQRGQSRRWTLRESREAGQGSGGDAGLGGRAKAELIVLVRSLPQLEAALGCGVRTIYCELEDPKRYREAVRRVREASPCCEAGERPLEIWVAPPRVFKTGETWVLEQVRSAGADGYLVRNAEQMRFFAGERRAGDYTLNIANRLSAAYFLEDSGLERVTASYDLNYAQLEALLGAGPAGRFEVTIHQHMPMFHMEHCVFCAFLSEGRDFRDCGRPCEKHVVELRDWVGARHLLKADAGCRNTVFNSQAQTGAEYVGRMQEMGVGWFRVEFLNENPTEVQQTVAKYRQLLRGDISGEELWRELRLRNQLGVTRGQMAKEDRRGATAALALAREW